MEIINIPLKNIAFQDERFRFSYIFKKDDLKASLLLSGLIYPPWGIAEKRGKFILVSGWKRVIVTRELGWKEIPFLVEKETEPERIWQKLIVENKAHRQLHVVDKAFIINKMIKMGINREIIIEKICPLLESPPLLDWINFYEKLAKLERETLEFIYEKELPEFVVNLLFGFSSEERKSLLPLCKYLSLNKTKEVLENLQEIALRDHLRPGQIISEFKASIDQKEGERDLAQQAEKWREFLKEKRFPYYQNMLNKFHSLLNKINWPSEIEIKPSPYFEKDEYRVSFSIKSENDLKKKAKKLLNIGNEKNIEHLLALIRKKR